MGIMVVSMISGSLRKVNAVIALAGQNADFATSLSGNVNEALAQVEFSFTKDEILALRVIMGSEDRSSLVDMGREHYPEWISEMEVNWKNCLSA